MGSVNKAILVGNLGRDAEMRFTAGGTPVATVSLATTERYTDREGQKKEDTQWHRVVIWGKTAETLHEYLTKGKQIYVEGRIQTREWTDKEGKQARTTEIRADRIVLLSSGSGAGGQLAIGTATPARPVPPRCQVRWTRRARTIFRFEGGARRGATRRLTALLGRTGPPAARRRAAQGSRPRRRRSLRAPSSGESSAERRGRLRPGPSRARRACRSRPSRTACGPTTGKWARPSGCDTGG